jgi:hypothetical protein
VVSLALPHFGPAIRAEPRTPAPRGPFRQTEPLRRRDAAPRPAPAPAPAPAEEGEDER